MSFSGYVRLARPFTLLAPFFGFVCFALVAAGSPVGGEIGLTWGLAVKIFFGALAAATLNMASNTVNQIFDREIDAVNKPTRPLVTGEVTLPGAAAACIAFCIAAIGLSLLVNLRFFIIVLVTCLVTYSYSGPPLRTKRNAFAANFTMALPRGGLLVIAGWSAVKPVWFAEPWFIAAVFFLFILGASTTKDFADMEGDARYGCRTLPVMFGVRRAAWIIAPFFVVPFGLLYLGLALGVLEGDATALSILAGILVLWGAYIVSLILSDPNRLATESNHPSWKHMYLLMVVSQIGFAVSYLV
ncbi:MAG TPA: UbiA family prenyltransferase [bacterium]|nr:UbiA family prenyltransferase [bacterium]